MTTFRTTDWYFQSLLLFFINSTFLYYSQSAFANIFPYSNTLELPQTVLHRLNKNTLQYLHKSTSKTHQPLSQTTSNVFKEIRRDFIITPYAESGFDAIWKWNMLTNKKSMLLAQKMKDPIVHEAPLHPIYGIGAGINCILNKNLSISVGYRYDWFNNTINTINEEKKLLKEQTLLNKFYSYTVLAHVRYQF